MQKKTTRLFSAWFAKLRTTWPCSGNFPWGDFIPLLGDFPNLFGRFRGLDHETISVGAWPLDIGFADGRELDDVSVVRYFHGAPTAIAHGVAGLNDDFSHFISLS